MQVGWQDKGDALEPVHYGDGLWLSGICDVDKLVWEVAVQIIVVAVVASFVAFYIPWEESENDDSCMRFFMCKQKSA